MNRTLKLFFILALFSALEAHAQKVPGYLGRRFMAGYELNFHPSLGTRHFEGETPHYLSTNYSGKRTGLRNQQAYVEGEHKLRVGFAATRSLVLMGNMGLSRTGFKAVSYNDDTWSYDYRTFSYKLSSINVGLEFDYFTSAKRGVAAPYGSYLRFSMARSFGKIAFGDTTTSGFKNEFITNWSGMVLSAGLGVNKIIGKHLIVNFGADLKRMMVEYTLPEPGKLPAGYDFDDLYDHLRDRMQAFFFFNAHIGISGLLF